MADESRSIHTNALWRALVDAGIFQADEKVTRIIIDAQVGKAVTMYVQRYGDERLLGLVQTLDGVEVRGVPAADGGVEDLTDAVYQELLKRKRHQGGTTLGLA